MSTIRKPHNLVTEYWDDILYFLTYAEKVEKNRLSYDGLYQTAVNNLPDNHIMKEKVPQLPTFDKRGCRYCILSSFLFLEAFINAEYTTNIYEDKQLDQLSPIQKNNLDNQLMKPFDEKWNEWVKLLAKDDALKLKGHKAYQDLMRLKNWRNHLTHYKIHNLMLVAHELETIANAREAFFFVCQAIEWYYLTTKFDIPEWIQRDILS